MGTVKRTGTRTGILLLFCVLLTALQLPVFAEEEPEIDEVVEYIDLDWEDDIAFPAEDISGNAVLLTHQSFTPQWGSPYEGQDPTLNYWTLPMDITDEAAVWQALTQPITVLSGNFKRAERTQITVRAEKSLDSEGVGVVTCETQGVHVLEREKDWSLIECYSSSFHDSKVVNWNVLIQGYVQTKYLKEVKPNQKIGFVIDKLTQRMYIFRDGKLFSTLLVSTGLSNERQPYNETRSGEFLLTTRVGDFKSDNMTCRIALRFNSGDLLHEVPYVYSRTDAGYRKQEEALGTRASHGCIRVQRKMTPEGINMQWIYDHHAKNTRLLLWEDWQGRQIPYPADDSKVYYHPGKMEYYHSQATCYCYGKTLKTQLEPIRYGKLDTEPYASLTRCPYCAPPLRKAEIDEINELHAVGGDHDPILTEAREYCPMDGPTFQKTIWKKK